MGEMLSTLQGSIEGALESVDAVLMEQSVVSETLR
jgi:hypothetical protein